MASRDARPGEAWGLCRPDSPQHRAGGAPGDPQTPKSQRRTRRTRTLGATSPSYFFPVLTT